MGDIDDYEFEQRECRLCGSTTTTIKSEPALCNSCYFPTGASLSREAVARLVDRIEALERRTSTVGSVAAMRERLGLKV